jgi:hypothetical protein
MPSTNPRLNIRLFPLEMDLLNDLAAEACVERGALARKWVRDRLHRETQKRERAARLASGGG